MPAVQCELQHGTLPNLELKDETGVLVQTLNISPTREKREFRSGSGCFTALRYRNPLMLLRFTGWISQVLGFADQHPGTAIAALANYATTRYGFDPVDGVTVYEDPSSDLSSEDDPQCSFNAVQYPFVV